MNAYLLLMLIVSAILGMVFVAVPLPYFIIGFVVFLMVAVSVLLIKKFAEKLYPIKIRVWGQRFGSLTIKKESLARERKTKDATFYELLDGTKIKKPESANENTIKGHGEIDYIDLYTPNDRDYFVLTKEMADKSGKLKVVPEDDRVWLAEHIAINHEVTTKKWVEQIPLIVSASMLIVVGIIMFMLISSTMQIYPDYYAKTTQTTAQYLNQLSKAVKTLEDKCGVTQPQPIPQQKPPI